MHPTTIPDELIKPDTARRVLAAPDGDLTNDQIRPVEALVSRHAETGLAQFQMRLVLEEGELQALIEGKPVWLTMLGGVAPFDVRVEDV